MRVTLVYRGRYQVRQAMDLETLVPVLRNAGHRVTFVYDSDVFGVTDNVVQIPSLARLFSSQDRILAGIIKSRPEVVIFSVLPSTYKWAQQTAAKVKDRTQVPVVFFSLFPSLVPRRVIRDSFVDYVIQGEADDVINPLLEAIVGKTGVEKVGNLWYKQADEIHYTYKAPFVDLDALPLPDKELFFPYVSHSYSYTTFISRGCTHNCTYCEEACMKKIFGPGYFRRKGVDTVIKELALARERYNFREVIFKDSYLSGNKKWLAELMARYRRRIAVPFKCFCTIRGFDDEVARLLKQAGCYCIEFGLQTWNDRVRREILARREKLQDVLAVFESCAHHRLWYDVDHMFNLPYETRQDHIDGALEYGRLRYLNRIKVHYLVYYPTAEIVEHGLASGKLPPDARKVLTNGYESDFYNQQSDNKENRMLVEEYASLYKILPILPGFLLRWFLKGCRVKLFRCIPKPLVILLQLLVAVRSGDLRFRNYLLVYPRKIFFSARQKLRRGVS